MGIGLLTLAWLCPQERANGHSALRRLTPIQVRHYVLIIHLIKVAPGVRPSINVVQNPKYTGVGRYNPSTFEKFNLPPNAVSVLVENCNAGLASSTWGKYSRINAQIRRVEECFERKLLFPFSESSTLMFCCYFLMRGCKSETIESNLSSLRTEHLVRGLDSPNLRPVVVKQLLQGNKNLKNLADAGLDRASVDIEDLKVIRQNLRTIGLCQQDAVLLWFAMLAMFYGSLRLHEIFPKKKSEYDPSTTLLRKNVKLKIVYVEGAPVEVLLLDLKSPKESKGKSVRVELFANGTKSCPVRAYKKLLHFWGHGKEWNIPLMTKSDGSMFSGREFNKLLKRLTSNIKKPGGKRILSHSFRSGIPTLMARAGYQDHEIQRQGRWRSSAFLSYCKLGRASRWKDQLDLSKRISSLYIRYTIIIHI